MIASDIAPVLLVLAILTLGGWVAALRHSSRNWRRPPMKWRGNAPPDLTPHDIHDGCRRAARAARRRGDRRRGSPLHGQRARRHDLRVSVGGRGLLFENLPLGVPEAAALAVAGAGFAWMGRAAWHVERRLAMGERLMIDTDRA